MDSYFTRKRWKSVLSWNAVKLSWNVVKVSLRSSGGGGGGGDVGCLLPLRNKYNMDPHASIFFFLFFVFFFLTIYSSLSGNSGRLAWVIKATAAAGAALPSHTSACCVFSCFRYPHNSDMDYRISKLSRFGYTLINMQGKSLKQKDSNRHTDSPGRSCMGPFFSFLSVERPFFIGSFFSFFLQYLSLCLSLPPSLSLSHGSFSHGHIEGPGLLKMDTCFVYGMHGRS